MADVRLTATNPEDSSVVPVACNEKGELKIEEPLGFDGTLDGNLSVNGSADVAGVVTTNDRIVCNAGGNNSNSDVAFLIHQEDAVSDAVSMTAGGSASFAGGVESRGGILADKRMYAGADLASASSAVGLSVGATNGALIYSNGDADFSGEVTVTSRSQKWVLVEQGGLCHMVSAASQLGTADINSAGDGEKEYPVLRDVFRELDLIESALNEVMERLRMTPPAGWEVWDGSDK